MVMIGMLTMSSDWNVEHLTAKYSSNPAKFRDLIREIKQRADMGLAELEVEQCQW